MHDGAAPIPSALQAAYAFLADDRAWVACIACRGCDEGPGPHLHTLASQAKLAEVAQAPGTWIYTDERCPERERASFVLGGVNQLVKDCAVATA